MRIVKRGARRRRFGNAWKGRAAAILVSMKSSTGFFLAALGFALVGCDDKPPPVPRPDGGPRDAATPPADAGDSADAGDDGDAGPPPLDGATPPDGGGTSGDTCVFGGEEDTFKLGTDIQERGRLVRIGGGPSGWAAVWADLADGFHDVRGAIVPSGGVAEPALVDLTDDPGIEREPAVTYAGGSWLVTYASNTSGAYETYAQVASGALSPTGAPTPLTNTSEAREDSTSVIAAGDGYLASWVQDDMVAGTRELYVQAFGADFSPTGSARAVATGSAGTTVPELAPVGAGAALAFVRGTGDGSEIVLQMLDAHGSSRGEPTIVADAGVEGTLDLAGGGDSGAIVYGLIVGGSRTEVRFRAFDADGALTGGTRVVVGSPSEGRDASVTPFAGGYAVAYRRIDGTASVTLVVALLSFAGEVVEELELFPTSPIGGRTTIEASGDGSLLVGFAEPGDGETDILAARVRCN
jgi:hypothetical protein